MAARTEATEVLLHDTRACIYALLAEGGPLALKPLADRTGASTSSLLWHLKKMKQAGIVADKRRGSGTEYDIRHGHAARLASAVRIVHSVPARELLEHLARHPGQHLAEAAAAIGAPRSRYWRVVPTLRREGLLAARIDGRRHRLVPTALAREAMAATDRRVILQYARRATRRT